MLVNYHTHTWRCHHAEPDERAYIEAAIAAGVQVLGFSDHTPYPFPPEHVSWFRMTVEEAPQYFRLIRELRDEYADRIEIHVGVEAEYYPAYFPAMVDLLRENGCEYMLLGQHFVFNEEKPEYGSAGATDDPAMLRQYVDQTIEGMETGLFTYLAHPDLIRFTGDGETYRSHMRRLPRGQGAGRAVGAQSAGVPRQAQLSGPPVLGAGGGGGQPRRPGLGRPHRGLLRLDRAGGPGPPPAVGRGPYPGGARAPAQHHGIKEYGSKGPPHTRRPFSRQKRQ